MCIKREQRRASRRKSGLSDNMLWCNNENRSALIFNNKQIFPIVNGAVSQFNLIARMVCYSRHHKSNEGFKILFVLKNSQGEILAQNFSNSIQIMDKKPSSVNNSSSNEFSINKKNSTNTDTENYYTSETNEQNSMTNITNITPESSNSLNLMMNNQNTNSIPNANLTSNTDLNMNLNQNQQFSMLHSFAQPSHTNTNGTNPIIPSPTSMSEDGLESRYNQNKNNQRPSNGHFGSNSITSIRNDSYNLNNANNRKKRQHIETPEGRYYSDSMNQSPMQFTASNTNSNMTPNQMLFNNGPESSNNHVASDEPSVQRAIPAQGPISGGIEITLLGSNFKNNLVVKFGNNVALSTQCWSDSTLVTYLPPAVTAGQVFISVESPETTTNNTNNVLDQNIHPSKKAIFTYVDDTDRQLIELALQIVGLKMNGKLEDARNIAKKIVGNDDRSPNGTSPNISPTGGIGSNGSSGSSSYYNQMAQFSDEALIVKVIKSLNTTSNLSMCDNLGRTLLHLASLKGYQTLVATLLKNGARVDDKDSFGYTPLHFACINGDSKIIQLLLRCNVDHTVKASNDMVAYDLFSLNHSNSHNFKEVLKIFELETNDNIQNRKPSDSSDFDVDSLNSWEYDIKPKSNQRNLNHFNKNANSSNSNGNDGNDDCDSLSGYSEDSGYERSDFEEFGDESLLASDTPSVISQSNLTHLMNYDKTEKVLTVNNDEHSNNETAEGNDNENIDSANNGSLWNRMLTRINDDLPKYEDLFPGFPQLSKNKIQEISSIAVNDSNADKDSSPVEDSQTSSEDEEEALQLRFNRFFQQRQSFQNDTMLWFFWLPLAILLISSYIFFNFGPTDDRIHYFSTKAIDYFRMGVVKILLGNDRMKAAFKEQLSNFQTPGIMNEINVQ